MSVTKTDRQQAELAERNRRLVAQNLELQRQVAELKHAHKAAFAILREAH